MNVNVQSSLQRGLVEGFTSYVLRNGKPEGIPINIGRLLWPTREDTKRWVYAAVVLKRLSEPGIVESITGLRWRNIIEREARE